MRTIIENTPIELTRCGKCKWLGNGCKRGNVKGMLVQEFFACACSLFEPKEVVTKK